MNGGFCVYENKDTDVVTNPLSEWLFKCFVPIVWIRQVDKHTSS
jgi:hypothetical protein